jgi:hypothetical protein
MEMKGLSCVVVLALLAVGCSGRKEAEIPSTQGAKELFEQTVRAYHLPSAEATGDRRTELLRKAAEGYQKVLQQHADESFWAAQALRNLASVRAAQTNLDEAARLYAAVAERYPSESFEVLQAWKAAADLLREHGRAAEGRVFDQRIVTRFDGTNQPAIVQTAVKACRKRLENSSSDPP